MNEETIVTSAFIVQSSVVHSLRPAVAYWLELSDELTKDLR